MHIRQALTVLGERRKQAGGPSSTAPALDFRAAFAQPAAPTPLRLFTGAPAPAQSDFPAIPSPAAPSPAAPSPTVPSPVSSIPVTTERTQAPRVPAPRPVTRASTDSGPLGNPALPISPVTRVSTPAAVPARQPVQYIEIDDDDLTPPAPVQVPKKSRKRALLAVGTATDKSEDSSAPVVLRKPRSRKRAQLEVPTDKDEDEGEDDPAPVVSRGAKSRKRAQPEESEHPPKRSRSSTKGKSGAAGSTPVDASGSGLLAPTPLPPVEPRVGVTYDVARNLLKYAVLWKEPEDLKMKLTRAIAWV